MLVSSKNKNQYPHNSHTPHYVSIYECPCCGVYGHVEKHSPNSLESSFKYYKCTTCDSPVQVNPYNIITIQKRLLSKELKAWGGIPPKQIKLDLETFSLFEMNKENSRITDYLPISEECYTVGDALCLEDLLNCCNMIEFESIRNSFVLKSIESNNIKFGFIGTEVPVDDPSSVWLSWTIVLPEFRSRGIGAKALSLIIEDLKSQGHTKLFVDCDNVPGTIKFYETYGFTKLGNCRKFRKDNPQYTKDFLMYDNDIVMYLDL